MAQSPQQLLSVKFSLATKKTPSDYRSGGDLPMVSQMASYIGGRESNPETWGEFVAHERMTAHRIIERIGPVTKVRHPLMSGGGNVGYVNSDLISLAGIPIVVLAWEDRSFGDYPAVTVSLDPRYLHQINWPEAQYLYELSIEDPRGAVPFGSNVGSKRLQMVEQSSEPIPNDVHEAFLKAIRLYNDWKFGGPLRLVNFRKLGQISIIGVCELVLSYRNEPLPADLHDVLWNLSDETRLKAELTVDPSYTTGAQCLLKLIDDQTRQASASA